MVSESREWAESSLVWPAHYGQYRHAYARVAVARINPGIIWAIVAILFILAVTISLGSSAKFIYFDF